MGDPELAEEKLIPNFWWNNHPDWAVMEGPYFKFKGNYKLVVDNLLDGSHVSFLHSSTLGTEAVADITTKTKSDKLNVRSERWIIDKPPAPMYQRIGNFKGNVDRWQLIDFVPPSNVVLDTGSCNTGQGKDNGFNLVPINSMTPENNKSTHVFWSHTRNFDLHSLDTSNLIRKQMTTAWSEDIFMMEQQQKRLNESNRPFISVKIDNAPERARKIIESLIHEEINNSCSICPIEERIKAGHLFGVTT
tara:strand:- start:96 stop:836 length:741 start_codon:yes stop_codon:yes gene_type:complete